MIVPGAVGLQYGNAQPYIKHLAHSVSEAVWAYCDREGFAFQSRCKTIESLAEKIESGRFGSWSEIDDLYACAVIIPSLLPEEDVLVFLRDVFEEVRLVRRGATLKDPLVFRFECTRFTGKLKLPNAGDESPQGLRDLRFEVQIRTAFEHAWLVATHGFSYKAEAVKWRRLRLAAQLKASVEQLDNLILVLEKAADHLTESHWPDVDARTDVLEFFRVRFERGDLPTEAAPKDWTRFCDNVVGVVRACGPQGQRIDHTVEHALELLGRALDSTPAQDHPRSLSLWQYTFGLLTRAGFLTPAGDRHRPLVTPELVALFPEVERFRIRFDIAS